MKALIFMASILLSFQVAHGTAKKKKPAMPNEAKLGTSFRFDGSSLRGKFQNSLGTTSTVENDKFLEDLLGARKSFEDRIARDVERN